MLDLMSRSLFRTVSISPEPCCFRFEFASLMASRSCPAALALRADVRRLISQHWLLSQGHLGDALGGALLGIDDSLEFIDFLVEAAAVWLDLPRAKTRSNGQLQSPATVRATNIEGRQVCVGCWLRSEARLRLTISVLSFASSADGSSNSGISSLTRTGFVLTMEPSYATEYESVSALFDRSTKHGATSISHFAQGRHVLCQPSQLANVCASKCKGRGGHQ